MTTHSPFDVYVSLWIPWCLSCVSRKTQITEHKNSRPFICSSLTHCLTVTRSIYLLRKGNRHDEVRATSHKSPLLQNFTLHIIYVILTVFRCNKSEFHLKSYGGWGIKVYISVFISLLRRPKHRLRSTVLVCTKRRQLYKDPHLTKDICFSSWYYNPVKVRLQTSFNSGSTIKTPSLLCSCPNIDTEDE